MKFLLKILFYSPILLLYSCGSTPKFVKESDKLENVQIQPKEALEKAKPFLEKHGTYHWNKDKPLRTTIVKKGKWYYIKRTNYPAKSLNYYTHKAVKIHSKSGKVELVK